MGAFSRLQEYPWIGKSVSRLVWFEVCFGVAASVVGAAFVIKKLIKAKKPHPVPSLCSSSPPPHSSLLPPYSRLEAHYLCPSLVIMSLNRKGDLTHSAGSLRDFGFIVNSQDEITTVWGSSWFLYDLDVYRAEGLKKLALGKVVVALEYPERYGASFEGIVVHVDYELDLAVIKFKDPQCRYKPTATLAELDLDIDFSKPYFGLDFFTCMRWYFVEVHCFKDDACESCRPYLHIDLRHNQSPRGVILDSEKKIVGMKKQPCNMCNDRGHVIPVSILSHLLSLYTERYFLNITFGKFPYLLILTFNAN